jgi:hypothetical protein
VEETDVPGENHWPSARNIVLIGLSWCNHGYNKPKNILWMIISFLMKQYKCILDGLALNLNCKTCLYFLQKVSGFLQVHRFPPLIKLTARI